MADVIEVVACHGHAPFKRPRRLESVKRETVGPAAVTVMLRTMWPGRWLSRWAHVYLVISSVIRLSVRLASHAACPMLWELYGGLVGRLGRHPDLSDVGDQPRGRRGTLDRPVAGRAVMRESQGKERRLLASKWQTEDVWLTP
jgi:hypothetical protein